MDKKNNTGNCNTGNCNTGNCNTGNCNTGNCNTGDWNTGDWNTSNYCVGYFSTKDYMPMGAFNKPCTKEEWDNAKKPNFIYFDLTEWINSDDMTDNKKNINPDYVHIGGYLKAYKYKEAWRKAWNNATDEDKELLYKLPNFDKEVFKEISGIDIGQDNSK